MQFSSIWPIDRALSGTTTLGQSEPESSGNKGMLHIPQSSSITGTSPSDCLVSYLIGEERGLTPSTEVQSRYSTAPADWAMLFFNNKNEDNSPKNNKQNIVHQASSQKLRQTTS